MAGFPVRAAGVEISRTDELRGRAARPLGCGSRQPAVSDLAGGKLDLRGTGRTREPHRNVLTRALGMFPRHRVLLRGPNSPMMVAAYLAVIKAGGVVVATMPLLRAKEIAYQIAKAKIHLALCDHRLAEEMEKARALAGDLERVVYWGGGAADALEALMA